jgi:hypothetical protein
MPDKITAIYSLVLQGMSSRFRETNQVRPWVPGERAFAPGALRSRGFVPVL